MTRAGIVAVVGAPNVGKSTLLNRLIGEKLSITSDKPQSTRDRVVGIRTTENAQLVLLDTPGLLDPEYPLQEAMRGAAIAALYDADVVLYLNDARDGPSQPLDARTGVTRPLRAPVVTVLNKIDLLQREAARQLAIRCPDAVFISARTGEGIDGEMVDEKGVGTLLSRVERLLPESPFLYPPEDISTQSMRFFVAELVRETALEQLEQEVPYSIACEVEEFREERSPIYIRVTIYVERESQKRILIGERGRRIREIGTAARQKIERLAGASVYLDLWVKVLQNWRRDTAALRRLGYHLPHQPSL